MAKILIVYASFGEGHKKAALSLQGYFNAECKDLLDFCPFWLKAFYSWQYFFITGSTPGIWNIAFKFTNNRFAAFIIKKTTQILFRPFLRYLNRVKPDVVISTHFFPPYLIEIVKKDLNIKLITIVTDLRVHSLWLSRANDFYITALPQTKTDLIRLGAAPNDILSGYVPLRPEFFLEPDITTLRNRAGFDNKPCVLFMSSIRGNFPFIRQAIETFKGEFNMIIICGKNARLFEYLKKKDYPSVKYFSYYEQIWELISLADVVVTKPGGLTIFEGMYKKKPFIFTHYIPGQEKGNMDLLAGQGLAKYADSPDQLIEGIRYFAKEKDRISKNYPLDVVDVKPALKRLIAEVLK